MTRNASTVLLLLGLMACSENQSAAKNRSAVADDVLFLVLGKMSLYDQSPTGSTSLRNHHFVAEIMPKEGRKIISGSLHSSTDETQVLEFSPEGNAFLAHGARVQFPDELHRQHPDGEYVFSYETESGRMDAQPLTLARRPAIGSMPAAAQVTLSQNGIWKSPAEIEHTVDLVLGWDSMPGNTKVDSSDLADLIFVLVFDCFGNNVAHSGRPYQGGPYLTYEDSAYTVPALSLEPGLNYTAIVEQATADVNIYHGVPGISTYATLTFVEFQTSGNTVGPACSK